MSHLRAQPRCSSTLGPKDWDRLLTWIDLNAPFYPSYASAYPDNFCGRSPLDDTEIARLEQLTRVPLRQFASHSANRGPQITFDRPERSPCLVPLADSDPSAYQEASRIVRNGRSRLAIRPESGMPGFEPNPLDRWRERKYQARRDRERSNRAALREGTKYFEPTTEPLP